MPKLLRNSKKCSNFAADTNTYPMPTIRYSIIIPHKDIPDLLNRLLRSIPQREDIEIFVVDDNSDPQIMASYKELEGINYRYTHESCGAGYARNIALREHGLFRYQQPVHDYLRKSTLSGAKVFFEFLRLGRQYNAGLFSAFSAWLKTSLFSHKQPPQQKRTLYHVSQKRR